MPKRTLDGFFKPSAFSSSSSSSSAATSTAATAPASWSGTVLSTSSSSKRTAGGEVGRAFSSSIFSSSDDDAAAATRSGEAQGGGIAGRSGGRSSGVKGVDVGRGEEEQGEDAELHAALALSLKEAEGRIAQGEEEQQQVVSEQDPAIWRPQTPTPTPTHSIHHHESYPWRIPPLPSQLADDITQLAWTTAGKIIDNQPNLDLIYFQPFLPRAMARELFTFLRAELFFYRVKYTIRRFGKEVQVNTPRFTSVFGIDETSRFGCDGEDDHVSSIVEGESSSDGGSRKVPKMKYKCKPRPIPECLDLLRRVTEAATNTQYNFCLVNYYATGEDSISYHSDDEHFLEREPAIASFSLGARRDFLMKHKPSPAQGQLQQQHTTRDGIVTAPAPAPSSAGASPPLKLSLASGDMVLMRGRTQPNWLHSIPKRKGPEANQGRINITLRKAMIPGGTENYYRYNVGDGGVFRWNEERKEMMLWKAS